MKSTPVTMRFATRRAGTSLVEVLMALGVMGIGLVAVAVLFPLSMIRSIQATQLTSAASLRLNVEELLKSFQPLVFDPDADWQTNESNWNLFDPLAPRDKPLTDGNASDRTKFNYIIDPLGWNMINPLPRNDPDWPFKQRNDPLLAEDWFGTDIDGVTPLNWVRRYPGAFGSDRPSALVPPPTPFDSRIRSISLATEFATLPDSWVTVWPADTDDLVTVNPLNNNGIVTDNNGNITGIEVPGADPLVSDISLSLNLQHRIILFDAAGRATQTRDIPINGMTQGSNMVEWNQNKALPPTVNFTPASAWIQVRERRYTWLLTVRSRDPINPLVAIDVVIYFNRAPALSEERTYVTEFFANSTEVNIFWDPAVEPEPFLKKGSFVFDVNNARWYRIVDIPVKNSNNAKLTIDRTAFEPSPRDNDGNTLGRAMLPKGIVEVYPIGFFTTPVRTDI